LVLLLVVAGVELQLLRCHLRALPQAQVLCHLVAAVLVVLLRRKTLLLLLLLVLKLVASSRVAGHAHLSRT
jgi:hypothetical protein